MHPPRGDAQISRGHEDLPQEPHEAEEKDAIAATNRRATATDASKPKNAPRNRTAMTMHTSRAVAVHSVMAGPINLARWVRVCRSASRAALFRRRLFEAIFEHPRAIDDAAEPAGHHREHGADARQQKHRSDGQLNDVGDRTDFRLIHARLPSREAPAPVVRPPAANRG